MHSSHMLREGPSPEKSRDSSKRGIVRDNMGHVEYRRDP